MPPANLPPRPLPPRRELAPRRELPSVGPAARTPAKRPDPRPMRIVYGAASVAALSALTVGLAHPQPPADQEVYFDTTTADVPTQAPDVTVTTPPVEVTHVINYVHLKPGETPPPGATVITPDAPAPRVVVTTIPGKVIHQAAPPPPASTTTTRTRVRTRQSGKP